jgi:type IV pilus assembly protein PilB
MTMTEQIERLSTARSSSDEIKRMAVEQGMRTLRQDGWESVARGATTIAEVLRVTANE